MRYFIEFQYKGTNYFGFQKQPNQITIQSVLEERLSLLLKTKIEIVGAGRTDAGVHSRQMFAHFDTEEIIPENLVTKLNAFLPKDIAVLSVFKVEATKHARFDALYRTYEYHIARAKNPFTTELAYAFGRELNIQVMNTACEVLFMYRDFECFSKTHSDVKTFLCEITEAKWELIGSELVFTITANRFLRNMVRAIVGTMLSIGEGKLTTNDLHSIIQSKKRSNAGYSVPACGLYLTKIIY